VAEHELVCIEGHWGEFALVTGQNVLCIDNANLTLQPIGFISSFRAF
jgi:hypothetical protein